MQDNSSVPTDVLHELKCCMCRHFLQSKAGLVNHLKSHGQEHNEALYEEALPARHTKHTSRTCGLVCKSAGGLTWDSKIHNSVPQSVTSVNGKFKCHICKSTCKTVARFKSYLNDVFGILLPTRTSNHQ